VGILWHSHLTHRIKHHTWQKGIRINEYIYRPWDRRIILDYPHLIMWTLKRKIFTGKIREMRQRR
jgi:hypothetical protein